MAKKEMDLVLVESLIRYEPEAGKLFWLARPTSMFASQERALNWNKRYAGKEAGCLHVTGYIQVSMLDRPFLAHRLAWALSHGAWPDVIDHINHDPADNRLCNLRSVTPAENSKNLSHVPTKNKPMSGVWFDAERGKWRASISVHHKPIHLGRFTSKEEAIAVRLAAQIKHGFHENHGRAIA